jgi:hypothetical protein
VIVYTRHAAANLVYMLSCLKIRYGLRVHYWVRFLKGLKADNIQFYMRGQGSNQYFRRALDNG